MVLYTSAMMYTVLFTCIIAWEFFTSFSCKCFVLPNTFSWTWTICSFIAPFLSICLFYGNVDCQVRENNGRVQQCRDNLYVLVYSRGEIIGHVQFTSTSPRGIWNACLPLHYLKSAKKWKNIYSILNYEHYFWWIYICGFIWEKGTVH